MKTPLAVTFVTSLLFLLSLAAQTDSQPGTTRHIAMHEPAQTHLLTITADDSGKEFTLPKNGHVVVKLAANPSTGYSWVLMGDPAPLHLVTTDYVQEKSPEAIGAPRVQQLKLKASGSGVAKLELGYRRPWEKDVTPAKTFSVTVKVE